MKGFTLLELVVVLAIAAAAAVLVVPQVAGTRALALKSAARELAAALRASRSEAIATQRDVRFVHASGEAIGFHADGTSTGGRIRLAADGRTAVVEVHRFTGRVAIVE